MWHEEFNHKVAFEQHNRFLIKQNEDLSKENKRLLKYCYELENNIKKLKGII